MVISKRAKGTSLAAGKRLRRAAAAHRDDQCSASLLALLKQLDESTARASKALDAALRSVAASQRRIAAMEAAHARRQRRTPASVKDVRVMR